MGTETDDEACGMNQHEDDEECYRQLRQAKEWDYFRLCWVTYLLHARTCARAVDCLSTRESTVREDHEK